MADSGQPKVGDVDKPEHEYIESAGPGLSPGERANNEKAIHKPGHKKELKEADEYANLGYSYPTWKKWFVPIYDSNSSKLVIKIEYADTILPILGTS